MGKLKGSIKKKRDLCETCKVGWIYEGDRYCANCGVDVNQDRVTTKIKYCKIEEEYRVLLFVDDKMQKGCTYYTDDKEDAKETAKAIIRDYKRS